MGILNAEQIKKYMESHDYNEKLMVTPLLTEDQIGPASVDIRLGSSIIVSKRTYTDSQDITDPNIVRQVEKRRYERIRLRYNSKFVLHPNELILGVTFEYLSLPSNVFCTIASRSSWGRLGLIIATASVIQPGYRGCPTLELVNLSASPIVLYPGLLVGQLVLHEVTTSHGKSNYKGRYDCPTEAGLPRFFSTDQDKEMAFWGNHNMDVVAPDES